MMSCPLAALADIATLAADLPPAMPPTELRSSASLSSVGSDTSSTKSSGSKRPMKKRPVADSAAATKKSSKKARAAATPGHGRGSLGPRSLPKSAASFPAILLGILTCPQNAECISFLSDDSSFVVVHPEMLAKTVLPIHAEAFGEEVGLEGFLGLLDKWGFQSFRDPKYPEVNVYRHPLFRKGDWEACLQMKLPSTGGEEADASMDKARPSSPAGSVGSTSRKSKKKAKKAKAAAKAADRAGRTSPAKARSVTPPESRPSAASPTTVPPLPVADAAAARLALQSAALEQTIAATAQSRHCLSGLGLSGMSMSSMAGMGSVASVTPPASLDELALLHYHEQLHGLRASLANATYPPASSLASSLATTALSAASAPGARPRVPTDAEVRVATTDVVSKAMAALHHDKESTPGASLADPADASRLDAMTALFLEQSNARRRRSRPAGIYCGQQKGSGISDLVDMQTRALLAGQR